MSTFKGPLNVKGAINHKSVADGTGTVTLTTIVDADGNLIAAPVTGEPLKYSNGTGISAGATQTQGGATALTEEFNNVTTCATDGNGVKLPTAVAGLSIKVKNSGATSLAVWPFLGDSINALAVNLSVNIAPGGTMTFNAISATVWETQEVLVLTAPTTQTGEFIVKATANDADTVTTLTNAAMGQASVISIPDPGAGTANVVLTSAANNGVVTAASSVEMDYVAGVTAGTGVASKALVLDSGDDLTLPNAGVLTLGNTATAIEAAEHGAGAIGTAVAPKTYRWIDKGVIITQTKIDLTGLGSKGGSANDVIGLPAGGDAYIGRNVVATNGVIFKAEWSCIESSAGSGSATANINVATNASGTIAYDGGGGAAVIITGGSITIGKTIQNLVPALTDNDYFYLVEADTVATDAVYTAGMYILTTYGHAPLA